jgi:hypothetical protein
MTSNKCGQKRQIDYDAVLDYSTQHPTLSQGAIASHFGITQSQASKIMRSAGLHRVRGRKPKRATDWELILHNAGLSMDRGLRVGNDRIYYGQDYDRL